MFTHRTPSLPLRHILIALASAASLLGACALPPGSQEVATPEATQALGPLPLSEKGMYFPGRRTVAYVDTDRNGREVKVTVWYPVVRPEGYTGTVAQDAAPDLSGAPYPLIVSSTKVATILAPYLVSHGFTWASVNGLDTYALMKDEMFSQPLDILFALDQVASNPPQGLEGVIDADHAGAIGYSFDGYNTLALSGARIDPQYYLAQCPKPDATTQEILSSMSSFNCAPATEWQDFLIRAGEAIATSDDDLWQPMTDPRIRAVMPMAAEGWWLFGAKGLAAVDRPVLIIDASEDVLYPENELIFEHLGTPEKVLITFVGPDHMMIYDSKMVARMARFATAFFGYHLQGNEDLKYYFSENGVAQQDGVAWGPYRND